MFEFIVGLILGLIAGISIKYNIFLKKKNDKNKKEKILVSNVNYRSHVDKSKLDEL